MVTIDKRPAQGGYYFEIADFAAYIDALQEHGIEPPTAQYRIFVSLENARKLDESPDDWRRQLELFYRLGESTKIPCEFTTSN